MPEVADDANKLIPTKPTLPKLRAVAQDCRACDLWQKGTQTVFGEGKKSADVMLVGEQPGDKEDLQGKPFVGPAGKLLDEALGAAGIERQRAYVTNVVKHFKWEPKGKRRIHRKPNLSQIAACRPWLDAELRVVKPGALVCLGATAAQALLGGDFRVSRDRGKVVDSPLAPVVLATVHPSSILRGPPEARRKEFERFVDDLRVVTTNLKKLGAA
jgi:uracil-DNA glycosylase